MFLLPVILSLRKYDTLNFRTQAQSTVRSLPPSLPLDREELYLRHINSRTSKYQGWRHNRKSAPSRFTGHADNCCVSQYHSLAMHNNLVTTNGDGSRAYSHSHLGFSAPRGRTRRTSHSPLESTMCSPPPPPPPPSSSSVDAAAVACPAARWTWPPQ